MRGIAVIITLILVLGIRTQAEEPKQSELAKAQAQSIRAETEAALAKRDLKRMELQLTSLLAFLQNQADAQSQQNEVLADLESRRKAFEATLALPKGWRYNWQTLEPEKIPDDEKK